MPVLKSSLRSKKSTAFFLASMVIRKLWCLKILHICFFTDPPCFGIFAQVASPSTRYNSTSIPRWDSWDRRNSPTNSHVSAPSKLPIVTSKSELDLHHGTFLL